MENLILAETGGTFSSFGIGFLAGFAFSVVVFLAFEVLSRSDAKRRRIEKLIGRSH